MLVFEIGALCVKASKVDNKRLHGFTFKLNCISDKENPETTQKQGGGRVAHVPRVRFLSAHIINHSLSAVKKL